MSEAKSDVQPPAESVLLNDAYKNSGLTAADLAASTSLSISAVRVALAGVRYRQGEAKVTIPPDQTVAKLASALGVGPQSLSAVGRERAAELIKGVETDPPPDLDTAAAIAGRLSLARQVLGLFSTEELRSELERRDRAEHEEVDQQIIDDAAEDLDADRWPG